MLDVLVADDDANVRQSVSFALTQAGHQVTEARDGGHAMELLSSHVYDLAICDVQMPRCDGMTLMRRIRREAPSTSVVLMTSHGQIDDAVESFRDGVVDYVTKPFDPDELTQRIVGPIAERRLQLRITEAAQERVVQGVAAPVLVAESRAMRALVSRVQLLAYSDAPVLVTGDRGTGKELVARTMHVRGARGEEPYVVLDGQLLGEMLAQDWLEFHQRAGERETWLSEILGGTLVLDGIDDLSATAQAHLLRIVSDPRSIATTGPNGRPRGLRVTTLARDSLAARVQAGEFLGSLYYRLSAVQVHVPSLAEREGDLEPLVGVLLGELRPGADAACEVSRDAMQVLSRYPFPGNVRQLRWALEHALVMSDGGPIEADHLPPEVLG